MTGRDLILYILQNNLEDKPVFENGRLLGFISPVEAAIKYDVGEATIWLWVSMNMLDGVKIGNTLYIADNCEDPRPKIATTKGVE